MATNMEAEATSVKRGAEGELDAPGVALALLGSEHGSGTMLRAERTAGAAGDGAQAGTIPNRRTLKAHTTRTPPGTPTAPGSPSEARRRSQPRSSRTPPLLDGADVEAQEIALEAPLGAKVSSKRALQFKGEARKVARRADDFAEQLRRPGGWRDVVVQLPSGGTERIYISPDMNVKTARIQTHTKKAKDILNRLYPQHIVYSQGQDGMEAALRELDIEKSDAIRA